MPNPSADDVFARFVAGCRALPNWVGVLTRREFSVEDLGLVTVPRPKPDTEVFEWVDLLEAVIGAEGGFTMLELGAANPSPSFSGPSIGSTSFIATSKVPRPTCSSKPRRIPTRSCVECTSARTAPTPRGRLRRLFEAAAWTKVNGYAAGTVAETPWGRMAFQDGLQTWANPGLA